ncbi:MAG TPA: DEAD/DEAH box helicase [Stellaceae bacterium]|nr:DEAD/DEAH box helicase [Stellaceae bacterium]
MGFLELDLSPEVLQAVSDAGYTTPTPIQQQAIPYVKSARDVLGCAQTGTGKTASFVLPMIDMLAAGRSRARMPRSLILEPTRELATQVAASFELYGKYHRLTMALLIGGESFIDQERKLDRGVDVLIATPGRLLDLHGRGKILLSDAHVLVIDEADRMLDMGFIPDVERIVGLLPKNRQTLFFSATMPAEIRKLADDFLNNPAEITVAPPASPAATVIQSLAVVDPRDKREALRRLLAAEDVKNALIFCNRKRDVDILFKSLSRHGFDAAALHGDMPQPKRTETLERFKRGEVRLLVASDVAARGLDIKGMSHVFCFDVPIHAEDYVHRIGRTGRAGLSGRSFMLAAPEDGKAVADIVRLIGKDIPMHEIEGVASAELDYSARRGRGSRPAARAAQPARPAVASRPARSEQPQRPGNGPAGRSTAAGERSTRRTPRTAAETKPRAPAPPVNSATVTQFPRAAMTRRPRQPARDLPARDLDEDRKIVGFGDDLPAFLARAPRVVARP